MSKDFKQLGWVDFSKSERNRILNILDLLSEQGTLDELGISQIRDGFSDLFFPATSTIQTRAKYFLCVPYALKTLELTSKSDYRGLLKEFDDLEEKTGRALYKANPEKDSGVIGNRSLQHDAWVKRTPSEIYWAGIRKLKIFKADGMSISEYLRFISKRNQQKSELLKLGNRNDNKEKDDNSFDDYDAGNDFFGSYWNLPTFHLKWLEGLTIDLNKEEADFLYRQFTENCKDSLFSYILKNNLENIVEIHDFEDLRNIIVSFGDVQLIEDFDSAVSFSEFNYVTRVVYNMIIFKGGSEKAEREWKKLEPILSSIAEKVNIDSIITRLRINNSSLVSYLTDVKNLMKNHDLEGLKKRIIKRERDNKGSSRAKTLNPTLVGKKDWYGGYYLDYRFNDAKTIMRDIFNGKKMQPKSE